MSPLEETVMEPKSTVCDYTGYDYKTQFWVNADRRYEDMCEKNLIRRMAKAVLKTPGRILDAGCGFGRIFPAYAEFGTSFTMLDFAQNMLDEAKELVGEALAKWPEANRPTATFVQGNLTEMPVADASQDLIVSVRTMHHIAEPKAFIAEMFRVLADGGVAVFEIPNKRHWMNVARFWLCHSKASPFSPEPVALNANFYNFQPSAVIHDVKAAGFKIERIITTSFFRSTKIKKWIPPRILFLADRVMQALLSWVWLTPSVFVVARKG